MGGASEVVGGDVPAWSAPIERFPLEGAPVILSKSFRDLRLTEYPSIIRVPAPDPVVDYLDSARAVLAGLLHTDVPWAAVLTAARRQVAATIAAHGVLRFGQLQMPVDDFGWRELQRPVQLIQQPVRPIHPQDRWIDPIGEDVVQVCCRGVLDWIRVR